MMNKKLKVLLLLIGMFVSAFFMFFYFSSRWRLSQKPTDDNARGAFELSQDGCGAIPTVHAMYVKKNFFKNGFRKNSGILILDADFSKWAIVTKRSDDGTVKPFVWFDGFGIEPGEQYCFSDGDHVMMCLEVSKIEGETAFLNIREKHTPPPTHAHLAYDKVRSCRVNKAYRAP